MAAHSPEILVIDDEAAVLAEVVEALSQAGYACHCCSSVDAARQAAAQRQPDLILSDINLGEESGLELCQELRSLPGMANTPVIFLSGASIPNIVKQSHAAGGMYYVRKPFDPQVLIELVEKSLWLPHLVANRVAT